MPEQIFPEKQRAQQEAGEQKPNKKEKIVFVATPIEEEMREIAECILEQMAGGMEQISMN